MMDRKIAFAPVVDGHSRVLFLGTMPSEESIRKQQYYGHKSNHFWKIIFSLFKTPLSDNYADRVGLILRNKIALWDVLASCEGQGSADSDIKEEQPNDFDTFFARYPYIQSVVFTSKKAEEFYKKYVGFRQDKKYITLPSPSPANARMSLSQKIEKWAVLLSFL